MRYVTAAEIKEIDRKTIEEHGIPGLTLMENAGRGIADFIVENIEGNKVVVLCGVGNNGGDGIVIARLLHQRAYDVSVFMLGDPTKMTPSTKTNLERLAELEVHGEPLSAETFPSYEAKLEDADVVVDALFGVGLTRPLEGLFAEAVDHINSTACRVIAVDIPSGLDADTGKVHGHSTFANYTLTMGLPKKGLALGEGPKRAGKVQVLDIGFPKCLLEEG